MYFPVLQSGVQAHYPVLRVLECDFAEVESPGGRLWRSPTEHRPRRRWILRFEDLRDAEAGQLRGLYEACLGGWRSFRFADPMANLLRWSEDIREEAWGKSPGIAITATRSGPEAEAEYLVVNASAAAGGVWQDLDLAPGVTFCFSCEIGSGRLRLRAGGVEETVEGGGGWRQAFVTGESSGGLQRIEVGLEAGSAIQIRRLQAETQRAPSQYQGTFESGGIYEKTRFAEGGLRIVSVAPDRNEAEVVLESGGENEP